VYLAGLYKAHQAKQPYKGMSNVLYGLICLICIQLLFLFLPSSFKELHEFPYSLYGCEHTNRMDQICGRSSETTEPAPSVCDEKKLTSQDFPSELDNSDALSDLNLSRFRDKSDQIDKYLREKQPFTNDIIVLPNICYTQSIRYERFKRFTDNPNQLDQFKFIKMINRKSIVDELFNNIKENDSCMVYGPQGCGKSFVVYQLACRLIQCGYFVVYINKTDSKLKSSIVRILNAKLKSIGVLIEEIFQKKLETIEGDTYLILRLIDNAERILLEKKTQKLIFVIDQVNNIRRNDQDTLDFLIDLRNTYTCVFSGSANNNPNLFEIKYMQNIEINEEFVQLDDEKFRALCSIFDCKLDANKRKMVFSTVGQIALQLSTFIKIYKGKTCH
jgi:hypothetical protein